jgi:zinc and cadmium transporter
MNELLWILGSGLLMSAIALVGGVALLIPDRTLRVLIPPTVAFAAGTLLGGGLFHLLPSGLARMGDAHAVFVWCAVGFVGFLFLEQLLHWHHCHRPPSEHRRPLTWLILVADAFHNFIGGMAVGGAFLADIRLGVTCWIAAAAHEVPQELGDFGVLVHGGWRKGQALLFNFASALTFLLGGLLVWGARFEIDTSFLLPFAAGNFLYVGAVDLVPEVGRTENFRRNISHAGFFVLGMGLLWALGRVL